MRIGMIGTGRMGKAVAAAASETAHDIVQHFDVDSPLNSGGAEKCDALIDFSVPEALMHNVKIAVDCGIPFVTGTTGWYDSRDEVKDIVEKGNGAFLYASNFSIGVLLFRQVVQQAAKLFGSFENFDFALHEIHHAQKMDSPSGTALHLGDDVRGAVPSKTHVQAGNPAEKIAKDALHISSTRVGAEAGTHRLFIDSAEDGIELTHRAKGRAGFAVGAIKVAEWLINRKGFYTIDDYVQSRLKQAAR